MFLKAQRVGVVEPYWQSALQQMLRHVSTEVWDNSVLELPLLAINGDGACRSGPRKKFSTGFQASHLHSAW